LFFYRTPPLYKMTSLFERYLRSLIISVVIFLQFDFTFAQNEIYQIDKIAVSNNESDEISPVLFPGGIVFSANQKNGLFLYSSGDRSMFKIYFSEGPEYKTSSLFSKDLSSKLNDGPVSFNSTFDTIYYSRNLQIDGKVRTLSSPRNKLGIFYAVKVNDHWGNISEFPYNSRWENVRYNVTMPSLSADGKRLYFASDMPGGYGGFDLYYSEKQTNSWGKPVNLGPVINTSGNEVYPFINAKDELFFSSDGHPGLGGRDIFVSVFQNGSWNKPIGLDAPVNSKFDDFGITTDPLLERGFFSSNREDRFNIYEFTTLNPQIIHRNQQIENQYCVDFSYDGNITIDKSRMEYKWDFGDGNTAIEKDVKHCYSGPGEYNVKLQIIDKNSAKLFFTILEQTVKLNKIEQAYIESPDFVHAGKEVQLSGLDSYLPGNEIIDYYWDLGDGIRKNGAEISHVFSSSGEKSILMGLTLKSNKTGETFRTGVSKTIHVLNVGDDLSNARKEQGKLAGTHANKQLEVEIIYLADNISKEGVVYILEVLSSPAKLSLSHPAFAKIPPKYSIREKFDSQENIYRYIVEEQKELLHIYPSFNDLHNLGFMDVSVRAYPLLNPAEKELYQSTRIYGQYADTYFDTGNRLTSNAYIMMEQIIKLMIAYPNLRLEIAVHTDNMRNTGESLRITQRQADLLSEYLVRRGIDKRKLQVKGYGDTRPIRSNSTEANRKENRRVEFNIITLN
jgi:outer membrane protein OmpA-like peptidoglycan-associated protein